MSSANPASPKRSHQISANTFSVQSTGKDLTRQNRQALKLDLAVNLKTNVKSILSHYLGIHSPPSNTDDIILASCRAAVEAPEVQAALAQYESLVRQATELPDNEPSTKKRKHELAMYLPLVSCIILNRYGFLYHDNRASSLTL